MDRKLQPESFLANLHPQADPPFCFSCGERKAYCKCKEGPLSRQAYFELKYRKPKDRSQPK